jgi:hypothetical protein
LAVQSRQLASHESPSEGEETIGCEGDEIFGAGELATDAGVAGATQSLVGSFVGVASSSSNATGVTGTFSGAASCSTRGPDSEGSTESFEARAGNSCA